MSPNYDPIIEKALAFIKARLSEDLSVDDIAKEVGYSVPWLKALFKKQTGKGVWSHLLAMRIEKAKELLQNTPLSISEIALHSGFNSYCSFAIAFRKETQCSPTQYRTKMPKPVPSLLNEDEREDGLRQDSAGGSRINASFRVLEGEWSKRNGVLVGKSEAKASVIIDKDLPENFRVCFEADFGTHGQGHPADLVLELENEAHSEVYTRFIVGGDGNQLTFLSHRNTGIEWNPAGTLNPHGPQKVTLELKDNTVRLWLDERTIFQVRDPFPAPFSARCRLVIGVYENAMMLRNLAVYDLGFLPYARTIRQGDALYNAGNYAEAIRVYTRQLESRETARDVTELSYKIGVCHAKQKRFSDARVWFGKIVSLPEKDFWGRNTRLALLDLDYSEGRFDSFMSNLTGHIQNPALLASLREIIQKAIRDSVSRGLPDRAIAVNRIWVQGEEHGTLGYFLAHESLGSLLRERSLFGQAIICFKNILESPIVPRNVLLRTMPQAADIFTCTGDRRQSEKMLDLWESRADNVNDLARSRVYRAFNLRAEKKFDEAVRLLQSIPKEFAKANHIHAFALYHQILILCMAGRIDEGSRLCLEGRQRYPDSPYFAATQLYLPDLVRKKYSVIARDIEKETAGAQEGPAGFLAHRFFLGGIFNSLAGKKNESTKAFANLTGDFPETLCAFYGYAAQCLLDDQEIDMDKATYTNQRRSELFYLLGLCYEDRGNRQQAQRFFEQSLREDLSLRWPAYLAGRKIGAKD